MNHFIIINRDDHAVIEISPLILDDIQIAIQSYLQSTPSAPDELVFFDNAITSARNGAEYVNFENGQLHYVPM